MKNISKLKGTVGTSLLVGLVLGSVNIGSAVDFVNRESSGAVLAENKPKVILESNSSNNGNAQSGVYVSSVDRGSDEKVRHTPSVEKNENNKTDESSKSNADQEKVSKTSRLEKIGKLVGTIAAIPLSLAAGTVACSLAGGAGAALSFVSKEAGPVIAFGSAALAIAAGIGGFCLAANMGGKAGAWLGRSINNIIYNKDD